MDIFQDTAERFDLSFIALFGSTARDGHGRDVDVVVMPRDPLGDISDRVGLYQALCDAFSPERVDLVVLSNASWLLSWEVARDGKLLAGSGLEAFREAAFWRNLDSNWWRAQERLYLESFLRGGNTMDRDVLRRRLLDMTK